ncbi:MAG TPA: septum formation initiator family protein [Ilumatobacteraceae bacterium]
MSDGHKTSTIPRPRDPSRAIDRFSSTTSLSSLSALTSSLTKPIPVEKQLVKGRGKRLVFGLVGTVIAASLIASLYVLPVKSWMQQRDDLQTKQNELTVLNNANAQLAADVNRLQTNDGIKEAARQELGYIGVGEERISVLSTPNAPLTLPAGWPYDTIAQIIAVRSIAPVTPVEPVATP